MKPRRQQPRGDIVEAQVGMPAQARTRHDRIDALRTLAMVWMTAFHFSFDLNHLGLVAKQNFHADPFWTLQRTCIVSLFLFTAGLSQAVALSQQGLWAVPAWQRLDRRFWQRWAKVAACALLVSAGSAVMFPRSFIYFGVLHGLAVMLILARLSAGWGRGLWWGGGVAWSLYFVAPYIMNISGEGFFLNEKLFSWLGLVTRKPVTEDFVPLVPWLAAVWWGLAAGRWVQAHRPQWLSGAAHPPPAGRESTQATQHKLIQWLALPGRWSLSYYMLHQPVMLGLLMAWVALTR